MTVMILFSFLMQEVDLCIVAMLSQATTFESVVSDIILVSFLQ